MSDIVERIRSLRYVHVPVASQLFEEAACEIERLRQVVEQKNLTDEEWEAVRFFSQIDGPGNVPVANRRAAALRGMLERMK